MSDDAGARISAIDDGARDVRRTTATAGNHDILETPRVDFCRHRRFEQAVDRCVWKGFFTCAVWPVRRQNLVTRQSRSARESPTHAEESTLVNLALLRERSAFRRRRRSNRPGNSQADEPRNRTIRLWKETHLASADGITFSGKDTEGAPNQSAHSWCGARCRNSIVPIVCIVCRLVFG